MARKMLQAMPARAVQLVNNGDFGGADLVQVTNDVQRPSFKEGLKVC